MASLLSRLRRKILARSRMWRHTRHEDGPFRFVVRRWDRLSDIDLAAGVCNSEFFSTTLVPQALDLSGVRTLSVIAPHQDDEAIGCGGLMIRAHELGIRVRVLFLTDGLDVRIPPVEDDEGFRAMRREEALRALSSAGAEMVELGLNNVRPEPTREHLERLAAFVNEGPDQMVCAPWLLDNPAKHRMTHHLLLLAHAAVGLSDIPLCQYQVHNMLIPSTYLDITDVSERKQQMIRCYESQMERTPYDYYAQGLSAWNSRLLPRSDVPARHAELFNVLPLEASLSLVERFYLADLAKTYRGHDAVLNGMRPLHDEVWPRRGGR